MELRVALKAAGFIALSVVGIPGNLTALLLFCHFFLKQRQVPHNEMILSQLVFANLTVMLSRALPQALSALGIDLIFNHHACKAILYTYRVARGMSVTITSLLSAYQYVVIAPSTHGWTWLKNWLPGHLTHAIIFLYGLNMIFYITTILYTQTFAPNSTIPGSSFNLKFCGVVMPDSVKVIKIVVNFLRDFFFVGLMVSAAVYVMLVLRRHRQQVQGLQGAGRKTEEASRAVLLLVSTYVLLFSLNNVLWFYTLSVSHVPMAVYDTRTFFSACYATISPVCIIATNKKLAMYFNCGSKHTAAQNVQSSKESKVSEVTLTA